jgi:16S rRNA (adenine1518-N6/adenine1519-N6)-dimethyltransferase
MKLSEMRQLLTEHGIRLTKSLGQNFLHDANQIRRIVTAAELTRTDKVLEIGPGLGPLTQALLESAGQVLAIEKDARLVDFLRQRFAGAKNLELIHDDALEFVKREKRDWNDWKVVANLPYSIGSPMIVELAQSPISMTVTLQLEVVRRLMAEVGTKEYGILTLLVQLKYESAGFFKIPPGSFFPEPDVDSGCVVLRRRAGQLLPSEFYGVFRKIVKRGFSQRRKMMMKLLRQDWPAERLNPAFECAKVAQSARAEEVSLCQFVTLTRALAER